MRTLLLSLLLVATVASGMEVPKKMVKKIGNHYFMEACWGEQNVKKWYKTVQSAIDKCDDLTPTFGIEPFETSQGGFGSPSTFNRFSGNNNNLGFSNPYQAWAAFMEFQRNQQMGGNRNSPSTSGLFSRRKRDLSDDDLAEFAEDVSEYKMMKKDVIGNVTCALSDIGILDSNLNININWYLNDVWGDYPVDNEFKEKLNEGIQACYEVSESLPQSVLNKNPLFKRFGKQIIFLKCANKIETGVCAKKVILEYMEKEYGPITPQMLGQLGLPNDRYDAAILSKKIMYKSKPESEKAVWKILMGDD